MIAKRSKTHPSSDMPLDCWCHITLFLSHPTELMNLLCTVKNLYGYIKATSPQCTKNVNFHLNRKIPLHSVPHVTNLTCSNVDKNDKAIIEYVKRKGSFNTLTSLFKSIFTRFTSLMTLQIDLKQEERNSEPTEISLSNWKTSCNFLVALDLSLPSCSLIIDHNFRNLESIRLRNKYSSKDSSVEINFSILPRLRELELVHFRLGTTLSETHPRLKRIRLVNASIPHLDNFSNLLDLHITGKHHCYSVHSPNSLERLYYTIDPSEFGHWRSITDSKFPNLDTLELAIPTFPAFPKGSTCEVRSLPRLRKFSLNMRRRSKDDRQNLPILSVCLQDLPNLKILKLSYAVKSEFEIIQPGISIPSLEVLQLFLNRNLNFDDNLVDYFSRFLPIWKDTLEEVDIRAEGEKRNMHVLQKFSQIGKKIPLVGFEGFSRLKTVSVTGLVVITKLKDCPVLENVKMEGTMKTRIERNLGLRRRGIPIIPDEDTKTELSGLLSLKRVFFTTFSPKDYEHFFEELKGCGMRTGYLEELTIYTYQMFHESHFTIGCREIANIASLKLILNCTKTYGFKVLIDSEKDISEVGGFAMEDELPRSRLKKISIKAVSPSPASNEIDLFSLFIRGLPNLVELDAVRMRKDLTLIDCPDLRRVEVETFEPSGETEVLLEDLPKLELFRLKGKGRLKNLSQRNISCSAEFEIQLLK